MKLKRVLLLVCFLVPTLSYAKTFTIFHTNDEHSRLLGFAPDYEYNPAITGDGTVGGAARLSTLLNQKRATAQTKGPMLTLEAGDFSMGTLFQLISREKGVELQLFKLLQFRLLLPPTWCLQAMIHAMRSFDSSSSKELSNPMLSSKGVAYASASSVS